MLIAVCEDQKNDRQLLLEYLNTELERLRICAEILSYESGEALLAAAQKLSFQIYFLDIFMVKTNGVDTARACVPGEQKRQLYLSLPAGIISRRALKWGLYIIS